ncbi:MAG: chemotaxis response regulator protein-glutamate methylesterase [Bacillota bacterium]
MPKPVRVLVADDSPFMRAYLTRVLEQSGRARVVAAVASGTEVLDALERYPVDVVTLDVEMPGMDGLACLRRIMQQHPTPVLMLSAYTTRGSAVTLEALAAGAVDFVPKPSSPVSAARSFADELLAKVEQAASISRAVLQRLKETAQAADRGRGRRAATAAALSAPGGVPARRVVAIGASTGGPPALEALLRALPPGLPAAVLITQHMPRGFTASLARRLSDAGNLIVYEAFEGAPLQESVGYVAPGGLHLTVGSDGRLHLDEGPPVHHVRPAVDVMLRSVAQHFGPEALAVILTGMGSDGAEGARAVKAAGGLCLAQDEASCVVAGMPQSVVRAGLADEVGPPEALAVSIARWARERQGRDERGEAGASGEG